MLVCVSIRLFCMPRNWFFTMLPFRFNVLRRIAISALRSDCAADVEGPFDIRFKLAYFALITLFLLKPLPLQSLGSEYVLIFFCECVCVCVCVYCFFPSYIYLQTPLFLSCAWWRVTQQKILLVFWVCRELNAILYNQNTHDDRGKYYFDCLSKDFSTHARIHSKINQTTLNASASPPP